MSWIKIKLFDILIFVPIFPRRLSYLLVIENTYFVAKILKICRKKYATSTSFFE